MYMCNALYSFVWIIDMYTYVHVPQRPFSAVDRYGLGRIEMSEHIVRVVIVYYLYIECICIMHCMVMY